MTRLEHQTQPCPYFRDSEHNQHTVTGNVTDKDIEATEEGRIMGQNTI